MTTSSDTQPRIAIFVSFSGKGGVERMILNLAEGLAGHGCRVDLLLIKSEGFTSTRLPPQVNVIHLNSRHTYASLAVLMRYLKKERPQALLAAKDRANHVAIAAKHFSVAPPRVAVRMGTTVSAALGGQGAVKKWLWYIPMRLMYRGADAIIAVSEGVKTDMIDIAGVTPDRITVIANPVVSPRIYDLAAAPPPHPWLTQEDIPVIIGAGRLTRQKDFPTLIKAFAQAAAARSLRLLILGDGNDRQKLLGLAEQLGIPHLLDLPGFVSNPYAYIRRSSLFVLSSRWEGSPNVLTEAMALGVPVVATDCRSGPREMLQNGRFGPLVPIGDHRTLAAAMLQTLSNPPSAAYLKSATDQYTVEYSSRRYLETLLGAGS